jgi:hypothetical protein
MGWEANDDALPMFAELVYKNFDDEIDLVRPAFQVSNLLQL